MALRRRFAAVDWLEAMLARQFIVAAGAGAAASTVWASGRAPAFCEFVWLVA
jgi:hypothetical protein